MKGAMVVVVISPLIATARDQCEDINRRVAGTAHGCDDDTDLAVCTVSDGEFGGVMGEAGDRPSIPPLSGGGTRPLPNSHGAELLDKITGGNPDNEAQILKQRLKKNKSTLGAKLRAQIGA